MPHLQAEIERFREHFYSQLELIHSLPDEKRWTMIKKSSYVMVIDSIGQILFPALRQQNRKRFSQTILAFGKWPHASYFSAPHLHQYLKVCHSSHLTKLATQLINPTYAHWVDDERSIRELPWIDVPQYRQVVSLDADIPEASVFQLTSNAHDKKTRKLTRFQHYALLYEYRNFLVHSLSVPGIDDRPEVMGYPYYEQYMIRDPDTGRAEIYYDLVYSNEFLYTLTHLYHPTQNVPYKQLVAFKKISSGTTFFGVL